MPKLPIFPLNTVLFPGHELPLRIFEHRYKQMLDDSLAGEARFVIALIRDGLEVGGSATPREVGTVARIENVGDRSADVIPLVAVGESRVRIVEMDDSLPYLAGDVEPIPEPIDSDTDPELLKRAQSATARFARAMLMQLRGEWRANPRMPDDPALLGYKMGTLLSDRPTAAQRVLEAHTITERLQQAAPAVEAAAAQFEARLMEQGAADHRRGMHRN
ncbi:MAG: LON peptidase substrate-binding domain-containing protein [Chloroflexi bacterium]|nr:LON peptidase substrate-binding domain-containing protein [Chloroflexota bacterium]MBT4072426.1 LON peptidase substrate-binding domain-containing protein [Chloroflexota bacterium]MBT4515288.1 LON peptidase substrate-binding domain-containing protein [Chloroflexota bacterium]MBT5319960.1 LON peptidase substrate-binding domain-containing protein [Chloroflexota bacterium]MBT6682688.1 LON peptidase substrate-binding domain-containing protein [Chloroflexota bacterium]